MEPVPVPSYPLSEETLPEPAPPLTQLRAAPGEQSPALLPVRSCSRHDASPQPPLLWAQQTQVPQPRLTFLPLKPFPIFLVFHWTL